MKRFALLACLLITSSVFAESTLTCQLKAGRKVAKATLAIAPLDESGTGTDDGLDVGEDNFTFSMEVEKTGANSFSVYSIFYENNSVQDQVGEYDCDFTLKAGTNVVCREPIEYDGKKVAEFTCTTKK